MPTAIDIELEPFFTARLPLPPSINRTYRPVRHGRGGMRMALSEEAALFKQEAAYMLSNPQCDWDGVNALREAQGKLYVPLEVRMTFYFASDKRDEDSGVKIAQDVIFKRLDLDDRTVKRLIVEKEVDEKNPRVEVAIRCLLSA